MTEPTPSFRGRCAVIVNPVKVSEQFRPLVEDALTRTGYEPVWLETSEDDPGRGMVAGAVEQRVALVLAAGGDGTVRLIADGLAGTGIPLGIVAAGTGNLLARNLGLPLDEATAVDIALNGEDRPIDLIEMSVDHGPGEHFAVMAGVGVDAVIMDETDPRLKEVIGVGAYVVAAAKAVGRLPVKVTVRVDGRRPIRRQSMLCLVGNVGELQGKITLIPEARPDDGLLNIYIASPHKLRHWLKLALRIVTHRPQKDDRVDHLSGRSVDIRIEGGDDYQLDGDVVGRCTTMRAEVRPGALVVRVPSTASTAAE